MVYWFAGSVKTTFDLPDDLVHELKLRSVHERRKLKDVAAAALRRGLATEEKTSAQLGKRSVKLPLFECEPGAPAARLTTQELIALEQKIIGGEDLKGAGLTL